MGIFTGKNACSELLAIIGILLAVSIVFTLSTRWTSYDWVLKPNAKNECPDKDWSLCRRPVRCCPPGSRCCPDGCCSTWVLQIRGSVGLALCFTVITLAMTVFVKFCCCYTGKSKTKKLVYVQSMPAAIPLQQQ